MDGRAARPDLSPMHTAGLALRVLAPSTVSFAGALDGAGEVFVCAVDRHIEEDCDTALVRESIEDRVASTRSPVSDVNATD